MRFFGLLLLFLVLSFSFQSAHAAYLTAYINPDNPTSNFEMRYLRTVFIDHEEGGEIVDMINSKFNSDSIQFSADSSNEGVMDLMNSINQKLASDGSSARISDLYVEYSAKLTERPQQSAIDYKIILYGKLTDYVIAKDQLRTLVDVSWRGITVEGPVVVNGIEINMPISYLKERQPTLYLNIVGTEVETLLSKNLINAEGIKTYPLSDWYFLFDPTGINVDKSQFGLDEQASGFVVSEFVMPDDSQSRAGSEKVGEANFTVDKDYVIRSIESGDVGNIEIIGFATPDKWDDLEVVSVTPRPPEGYRNVSVGAPNLLVGISFFVIVTFPIFLGIFAFFVSRRIIRRIIHQKNIGRKYSIICIVISIAVLIASGIPFLFFHYWYGLFESFSRLG